MIVGNLFQQAYTIVDSAIVGHYNGEAALAAVGASSALTTIFICVAIGGGIGASVIISQHFGAKRFAPKCWLMMTDAPMPPPMATQMKIVVSAEDAPTAASAASPL